MDPRSHVAALILDDLKDDGQRPDRQPGFFNRCGVELSAWWFDRSLARANWLRLTSAKPPETRLSLGGTACRS